MTKCIAYQTMNAKQPRIPGFNPNKLRLLEGTAVWLDAADGVTGVLQPFSPRRNDLRSRAAQRDRFTVWHFGGGQN
jgi:hypothetical protein